MLTRALIERGVHCRNEPSLATVGGRISCLGGYNGRRWLAGGIMMVLRIFARTFLTFALMAASHSALSETNQHIITDQSKTLSQIQLAQSIIENDFERIKEENRSAISALRDILERGLDHLEKVTHLEILSSKNGT
jgi:hypothetical protein